MGAAFYAIGSVQFQAEQEFFRKNPNNFIALWGKYTTIGGHLLLLEEALSKPIEGQRLGDIQFQETIEGAALNRCFGPENRVAGAVVWMTDLREVKNTESGAGKGGSGGEFITYQYFAHVLVKFCRAEEPIYAIKKVWADGKDFYDDTDNVVSTYTAPAGTVSSVISSSIVYDGTIQLTRRYVKFATVDAGALRNFKSGNRCAVSGYTGGSTLTGILLNSTPVDGTSIISLRSPGGSQGLVAGDVVEFSGFRQSYSVLSSITVQTTATDVTVQAFILAATKPTTSSAGLAVTVKRGQQVNNGSFKILASGRDGNGSAVRVTDETNPYRLFVAVPNTAPSPPLTFSQTNPLFKKSRVEEVIMLLGGPDQVAQQLLIDNEPDIPAGQHYGMRNYAGMLLKNLNLTDSGNRVANFEGLIAVTAFPGPVADAITTILTKDANIPSAQIDVSLVEGELRGYTVNGPRPPKESLTQLIVAFDLVAWERAGVIHFASKANLEILVIPVAELGAKAPDDETRNSPLLIQDPARDHLPSEVLVSHRSSGKDFQTASKRARRTEHLPVNVRNISFDAMVLNDDEAQRLADRILAFEWGIQRRLSLTLPQSRAGQVHEGMILAFGAIYGQSWQMIVDRVDRGANMLISITGQEHDPNLLVQTAIAEGSLGLSLTGNTQDGKHGHPAPAELILLDAPALSDQHRSEPGVYVGGYSADISRPWRGGVLYWSTDSGLTWKRVVDVLGEVVAGDLVTPPSVAVDPALWDRANTVRVKIRHPTVELGGVSEEECLLGRSRWMIGREIVGAARVAYVGLDADEAGARLYDFSVLLRGQQDTDRVMDGHVVGEQVVWLDGPGMQFLPLSFSHVDKPRLWRLVPHGGLLDDALVQELAPGARNCRPFHVRDVKVSRDVSSNITWTWERASRAARTFLEQGEPLDEEVEQYEIDVVLSGVVKRTIDATGARTAAYTAAQGTSDGVNTSNPVTIRLYQISQSFRRGQGTEVTL